MSASDRRFFMLQKCAETRGRGHRRDAKVLKPSLASTLVAGREFFHESSSCCSRNCYLLYLLHYTDWPGFKLR